MITLVCGDNLYTAEALLKSLMTSHDGEVVQVDLSEEEGFEKLTNATRGASLFTDNDFVVARHGEEVSDIVERLGKILPHVSDSTNLVLYFPNLKKLDAGKLKLQIDKTYDNQLLDVQALVDWLVSTTKERGKELDRVSARFMVDWIGNDQMTLSNELEKLLLLGKPIQESTIREATTPSVQTTIFQMLDAMISGLEDRALSLYNSLISGQFDAGYVMSMIAWQAQALAVAVGGRGESTEVIKATGISPYVLSKAKQATQKLSKAQLIKINEAIIETDKQLKTREVDETRLVEQLITKISYGQATS